MIIISISILIVHNFKSPKQKNVKPNKEMQDGRMKALIRDNTQANLHYVQPCYELGFAFFL